MDHVPPQRQHDADDRRRHGLLTTTVPPGRHHWLLAGLALLGLFGFVALGVWQLERRVWKLDLIARVDSRIHAAPVPLAALEHAPPQELEYRRVRVTGVYRQGRETLVQAVTRRGSGFWVLSPLQTERVTVLINRGFVPGERSSIHERPPSGRVTVTGLIRRTEPGGGFLRANDTATDRWYSRDVAAIARARALGSVAPFFIDAEASKDPAALPVGGLTVVRFPNNHLVYALTWFALAGLCGYAVYRVLRYSDAK